MHLISGSINSKYVNFLSAEGEMSRRILDYDWSKTSLGPLETWPQSLLTTLSILLHSKFPMILFWGNDRIQFYNDAYRPSLGNEENHPRALGKKGEEFWGEVWVYVSSMIERVYKGDSTWDEDLLVPIHRNGKMEDVYWTFSYSPVFIEDGTIGAVLVVVNETTQAVTNLKRIEESEDKLRFAIDAAEFGTWDFNPHTNTFDANDRLKEWFGLPKDKPFDLEQALKSIDTEDVEYATSAIAKAMSFSSGGLYNIEYAVIHPITKQRRYLNAKGRSWFNENKELIRFNGVLQDITEDVLYLKKLECSQKELQSTTDRLELALDSGEIGHYEWDIDSDVMKCNNQYKKIFGYSEFYQPTYQEFTSKILPTDVKVRNAALKKAIHQGGIYNAEYRIVSPNEEIRWVKSFGKVLCNDENKPTRLIGMILDITEHKIFSEELARQVRERTAELKQTNTDLSQFAHVASHDLKEPVRKVKIFCGRLQDEYSAGLPERAHIYLEKIQQATNRMISMIDGVLTYSTLTNLDSKLVSVDINLIIEEIKKDLELIILEKNARIYVQQFPNVEGIEVLIYQLFYNLILNALKFSKEDESCTIHISYQDVELIKLKYLKISISDNGIGFSNESVSKMFDPFVRLNAKDKYEGTGLGLAL
ncbi:PAS domain-containing protein, partial [uncultured Cytophaga sp.]|uniref:PAS domain-containing sensor histidine kinase n=1 Tax=uncultured Cytophaga sp. TaxID=160238 RepID=UPI0026104C3A